MYHGRVMDALYVLIEVAGGREDDVLVERMNAKTEWRGAEDEIEF